MPRDLPLANGNVLVTFDSNYWIRDLYYPHIGAENQTIGDPCRLGVFADGKFSWSDDGEWRRDMRYETDTLVTSVTLEHPGLDVKLRFTDAVHFTEPVLVRRISIQPGGAQDVRIFLHLDLHISGYAIGDTAYYDPDARAIVHYKGRRYFLHGGIGSNGGIDQFACGQKEFHGMEGVWRDAEDGTLAGGTIAQGSVDSIIALHASKDARAERILYAWLCFGEHLDSVRKAAESVAQDPEAYLAQTRAYWQLWCNKEDADLEPLGPELAEQYRRSLLIIRTQIDHAGGILAANDSDVEAFNADTYSYVWQRDGSLVAFALDEAGYHYITEQYFRFCARVFTRHGYFSHRYNPDGTLASSWHPRYLDGAPRLPIQEDETALVLWSLWHHYELTRSVEFIAQLYAPLVLPAAEFLTEYVDGAGLCKPSYDLWEERWGVHAFTVGTVYGALNAASNFAGLFGDGKIADRFDAAAGRLASAVKEHMFDQQGARFARMVEPLDNNAYQADWTPDVAVLGLFLFGMFDVQDDLFRPAAEKLFESISVGTSVGGCARYAGDTYFRDEQRQGIPGNPWFIATLWRARYEIARAQSLEGLESARTLLDWVRRHAMPSGVLSEQLDPDTGKPLSVSPLTWSHAEYVVAYLAYLDKVSTLHLCPTCHRPLYMREHERLHRQHEKAATFDITSN